MPNRFSVTPAKGYGSMLTGLGDRLTKSGEMIRGREKEAASKEYMANMKAESAEAYASGDINRMIETSLKYPEIAKTMTTVMQHKSEQTEQNYQDALFEMYVDPSEQNAQDIIEVRQEMLESEGADSTDTDMFLDRFREDPEGVQSGIEKELAFRYPDKMKRLLEMEKGIVGKDTASQKEYNMAVDQGYKGTFMEFKKELGARSSSTKQKTSAVLVRDKETGQVSMATGVFDTSTGKLNTAVTPLTGYEVVSKLGETGKEESERKVEQKRGETEVAKAEARADDLITRGIAAAESTATIRRAIDLLDTVKTGGLANLQFQAKRLFGIEGADEGELSNSLGKSVLSQLRETFGAAFTENEGKRLERIEGSFGKSPETNKRLLNQALRIANRAAMRARKAAEKRGDTETLDDIDDLLSFNLSMDPGAEAQKVVKENPTPEEYETLSIGDTYYWDGIPYVKKE